MGTPGAVGCWRSHQWLMLKISRAPRVGPLARVSTTHHISFSALLLQKELKHRSVFRSCHLNKDELCVIAPPYGSAFSWKPVQRKYVKLVL